MQEDKSLFAVREEHFVDSGGNLVSINIIGEVSEYFKVKGRDAVAWKHSYETNRDMVLKSHNGDYRSTFDYIDDVPLRQATDEEIALLKRKVSGGYDTLSLN